MGELILTQTSTVDLARRRIRRADQSIVLSQTEAEVLAYLAARPNQDVPRDELLRAVWGRRVADTGRTVDSAISRLRHKLGEPELLLTAHGVGYRFVPHASEGGPTASIPVGPRTLVRTSRGVIDLDRQMLERVEGGTTKLTRLETALVRQLATSPGRPIPLDDLARQIWGRGKHQHSASTAIGRLRKKLERDPSRPEVLVTTPGVGIRIEGEVVRRARTNLVPIGSSFVAGPHLGAGVERTASHRLVTLVGTAGVGKTRLARQLGVLLLVTDPRVEVWFCDLASVGEGRGIVETVASSIGLDPTGEDLSERVGRALAHRPAGSVLILDNYEHLLPFASLVAGWYTSAPDLKLWVTSRVALGLADERLVEVEPLDEGVCTEPVGRAAGASRRLQMGGSRTAEVVPPAILTKDT